MDEEYYFQRMRDDKQVLFATLPDKIIVQIARECKKYHNPDSKLKRVSSHDLYKIVHQLYFSASDIKIGLDVLRLKFETKYESHLVKYESLMIEDKFLEAWLYHLKKPGTTKWLPSPRRSTRKGFLPH